MHYSWLRKFVLKHWRGHTNQELRILQPFSNILKHMLPYNLTSKLFGKFFVQNFESERSLHSPFIRNFCWTCFFSQSHHYILPNLHNLPPFLNYDLHKKTNTFNAKKPSWKKMPWWLYILILFRIFSSQNIM